MTSPLPNYAFIDGNNLHLTMKEVGWTLDYARFRVYLRDKYNVSEAYYFIGYIRGNEDIYSNLKYWGYKMIFKSTFFNPEKGYKGNCDAELVLQAMIDLNNYGGAVIVSSDGDFRCLVEHLLKIDKLERVLAPCRDGCSKFLRIAAGVRIDYVDNLREKLAFKRREAPREN